ncbi:hypothetical protein M1O18_06895, partial [Dehalococcoidia bacterium]|nr:hypothetical protein [Dehalococcoidia bacterium]
LDRLIGSDEGFLHRVLGIAPVLEDSEGNTIGSRCMNLHQLPKSLPVSFPGLANQGYFFMYEIIVQ